MSDPMMGGQDPRQNLEANRSVMNPTDLNAMQQQGQISPDMSVRQFLENLGINVEGPAQQLVELQKKHMQNASPTGKMQSMAQGASPSIPQQGRRPEAETPGLEGLRQRLGA